MDKNITDKTEEEKSETTNIYKKPELVELGKIQELTQEDLSINL